MKRLIIYFAIVISLMLHAGLFFLIVPVPQSHTQISSYQAINFSPRAMTEKPADASVLHKQLPVASALHTEKSPFSESIENISQETATVTAAHMTDTATLQESLRDQFLSRVEREKTYPRIARIREIQGVVDLHVVITKEGILTSMAVTKSSGSAILDHAAEALIQRVMPFPHDLAADFSCELSIGYWLK